MEPLAARLRPLDIDEVIGQKHLIGEGKILTSMVESGNLLNMIFYGPPGTGKTTMARLIAKTTDREFYMLNASVDSLKDVKEVLDNLNTMMGYNGIVLYIDEIHMFNKRNQQILLDYIESGKVILIGSTTENPHFSVFKALLSRSLVVEFKPLDESDILEGLEKGISKLLRDYKVKEIHISDKLKKHLAFISDGDMRKALNYLEILFISSFKAGSDVVEISEDRADEILQRKIMNYDTDGDVHYDLLSALHKSIRGSDPDAALLYLAMLIKGGDLQSICRRILAISSEDVGLAYPNAVVIVKACVDSALFLGFPEAKLPLSQAVILLATSPKSNSSYLAIAEASKTLENFEIGEIPLHLRDGHYEGAKSLNRMQDYLYPHNYPDNYVKQQYLPSKLKGRVFYNYGNNKLEQTTKGYWDAIKNKNKSK